MSQSVWDAIKVMWLCNTTQSPRTLSALGMNISLALETGASNACVIALLGSATVNHPSSMRWEGRGQRTWQWGAWGFALTFRVPHTIDAFWLTIPVLEGPAGLWTTCLAPLVTTAYLIWTASSLTYRQGDIIPHRKISPSFTDGKEFSHLSSTSTPPYPSGAPKGTSLAPRPLVDLERVGTFWVTLDLTVGFLTSSVFSFLLLGESSYIIWGGLRAIQISRV